MSEASVRWLLVGTGDIARKRVGPALVAAANSQLAAVCGRNPERTAAFAAELGARTCFTDFDEAVTHPDISAVYLATPVDQHVPQAMAALNAGKHVLVEKPLGLSGEECQALLSLAAGTRRVAGCSYYRRCSSRFAHASELLATGELGEIVLVRMAYRAWFNPSAEDPKRWRVQKSSSGGGPLADVGSHMLDLLIGLLGMPRTVVAAVRTLVQPYAVEDSAGLVFELQNGALATGSFHWNSKTWTHEFEIVGTEGSLKWIPFDTGPVVKTVGRDSTEIRLPQPENVHLPLIADFVRAIRGNLQPAVPLTEAVKANRLLDAIYLSSEEGRAVAI